MFELLDYELVYEFGIIDDRKDFNSFFYASEIPQLGSITTQLELITLDEKSKINDREMFMKVIDYSYYYEEAE